MSLVAVVSLKAFVSGLMLGGYAVLHGIERTVPLTVAPHERRSEHAPASEPSVALNRASIAACLVGLELAGDLACTLPVRAMDGAPPAEGGDVVIDRVEDGVGSVEPWAVMEGRR